MFAILEAVGLKEKEPERMDWPQEIKKLRDQVISTRLAADRLQKQSEDVERGANLHDRQMVARIVHGLRGIEHSVRSELHSKYGIR